MRSNGRNPTVLTGLRLVDQSATEEGKSQSHCANLIISNGYGTRRWWRAAPSSRNPTVPTWSIPTPICSGREEDRAYRSQSHYPDLANSNLQQQLENLQGKLESKFHRPDLVNPTSVELQAGMAFRSITTVSGRLYLSGCTGLSQSHRADLVSSNTL